MNRANWFSSTEVSFHYPISKSPAGEARNCEYGYIRRSREILREIEHLSIQDVIRRNG